MMNMENVSMELKKYTMASIVMNRSYLDLLDSMICNLEYPSKLSELVIDARKLSQLILDNCLADAVGSVLSEDELRSATTLFGIFDSLPTPCDRNKKIETWFEFLDVIHERNFDQIYILLQTQFPCFNRDDQELTISESADRLISYASELEWWLEHYFSEDYDPYEPEDQGFDDILRLIVALEFIGEKLNEL